MTIKKQIQENIATASSAKELATQLGIKLSTVRSTLTKLKIKLEGSGGKNRLIQNNPFTEKTDTCFYWLGYIVADGNISNATNTISVISKDIAHLEKYNSWLNNRLNPFFTKKGTVIYSFAHKLTKDYLVNLGITPKKSLTLHINMPITWAFLRGVFDGDGSVRDNPNRTEVKITSGSIKFLSQIKEFLDLYNIKSFVRVQQKKKPNNCYQISISMKSVVRFFDLLYENAEVFLERKYIIMHHVAEKRRSKSGELLGTPKQDNQQPSSENGIKLSEKVQRIGIEEPTNNIPTSAGHPI